MNTALAIIGLSIALFTLGALIGRALRRPNPQTPPTCGNCRYHTHYLDGPFCDRRALWKSPRSPACPLHEAHPS